MIPLNLSSLTSSSSSSSHRQLNGGCDSCRPTPTATTPGDDRCRCRQNAMMTRGDELGGGGGGGAMGGGRRAKRVRFADDEIKSRPMRKRKEHHQLRECSNRKRQRIGADENKGDNTTDDTQIQNNFDWSESPHLFRSTTTPVMMTTTTSSSKTDDYDNDENSLSSLHRLSTTDRGRRSPFPSIPIPHDPRLWSRLDVYNWLEHMKSLEIDLGDLDTARFLMNGKALCLMTPAMFIYRVPHGGRILYKDFQTRLCRAVAEVQHRNKRTPI